MTRPGGQDRAKMRSDKAKRRPEGGWITARKILKKELETPPLGQERAKMEAKLVKIEAKLKPENVLENVRIRVPLTTVNPQW